MDSAKKIPRRSFMKLSGGLVAGATLVPYSCIAGEGGPGEELNIIGPRQGYSVQVGTFISMLNWMRESVIRAVDGLKQEQLDFLIDAEANTIGSLLLHLAATEVLYQDLTFYGLKQFSEANEKKWSVAMELGAPARNEIKGNTLEFYLEELKQIREKSLAEFRRRDDKWLAEVDPHFFGNQPTNNYCKWFHVCEHEANHRGQITWIRKRLPGSKASGD